MFPRSKIQDIKLRKRSRAISSRQGLMMSETRSLTSPAAASLFASPKGVADSEAAASPTSILETKPFSAIRNPFFSSTLIQGKHLCKPPESQAPTAIGLGLLDALAADDDDSSVKCSPRSRQRLVVFGSQLKIQIPPPHSSPATEFGIESRSSRSAVASYTPAPTSSPRVFAGCLPQSEIELSEEYTCVILHGPNPKTTHIFDNCVIQSRTGYGFVAPTNEKTSPHDLLGDAEDDFLSFCYGCKKKLGPGEDVYIYRGEKAFCSHECRYQEMLSDEGDDKF